MEEFSQAGPITRKAFFMVYGRHGIVAEVKFDNRRRHLNFQIGAKHRAQSKGKKMTDQVQYPAQL